MHRRKSGGCFARRNEADNQESFYFTENVVAVKESCSIVSLFVSRGHALYSVPGLMVKILISESVIYVYGRGGARLSLPSASRSEAMVEKCGNSMGF